MADHALRLNLAGRKIVDIKGPADITKESTEAIVNAANSGLRGGGGVDGAIHRAGGPSILKECERIVAQIGHLPEGKAVITTAGRMAARYVIHTVGPVYGNGRHGERDVLASCYRECLRLAEDHAIQSVAFPSISTGAYGYPVREAALVAVPVIIESLRSAAAVKMVRFILFDSETLQAYTAAAEDFLKSNPGYPCQLEKSPS